MSAIPCIARVTVTASIATSSVQISNARSARRGFIIYNNSANSVYITYGATSSSSACSVIIATFAHYVHVNEVAYSGAISAIRNAGSGTLTLTEFFQ